MFIKLPCPALDGTCLYRSSGLTTLKAANGNTFIAQRVIVTGGMNRPAFAENDAILELYGRAAAAAQRNGYALGKQHRGGGSDGNFTAALGIPTLDGLGCPGAGAHAPHEHILWRELAARGATIAHLLETLE